MFLNNKAYNLKKILIFVIVNKKNKLLITH